MTITDWPAAERPREKLLARGPGALSDAELLAIFLGSGRRGQSAVDLGRDLLSRHGSLKALLDLPPADLTRQPGLGAASACRLHAALELGRRHLAADLDRPDALANPLACAQFLRTQLDSRPFEVFAGIFLDNRLRMIAYEELFRGSLDGTSVYPREVVRRCLAHNAAAVIFAHNHPSGVAEPSHADREITAELRRALATIEVRVVDHFVVGAGGVVSLAQRGML